MQNGQAARKLYLPGQAPPAPEPPCYFDAAGQVQVRADFFAETAAFWHELTARINALVAAKAAAEQERDALRAELERVCAERDFYLARWQQLEQELCDGA